MKSSDAGELMPRERDTLYHDEYTERLRQMFQDAELRRESRNRNFKIAGFWFLVIATCVGMVMVKLWSMGAIVGVK